MARTRLARSAPPSDRTCCVVVDEEGRVVGQVNRMLDGRWVAQAYGADFRNGVSSRHDEADDAVERVTVRAKLTAQTEQLAIDASAGSRGRDMFALFHEAF